MTTMSSKTKTAYLCQACGAKTTQWTGYCLQCGAWNSITEEILSKKITKHSGYTNSHQMPDPVLLSSVEEEEKPRFSSGMSELDRVLGGGLVKGAAILLGGDPGIGKSTILLQTLTSLSRQDYCLYVSGEESLQQISLRAQRLELNTHQLHLLTETQIERIIDTAAKKKPRVIVIDSIQTMYTDQLSSAAGSVSQVRECAAELVRFAKQSDTVLLLIGHVTKEGHIAGPRVLEHMVDTVLYFESTQDSRFRLIRAVKNRFGAVNELGIFAMTETGLTQVQNPSAIFLSRSTANTAGSVIMSTWEGTRPLLVEIQALVDKSYLANPRRVTVGVEQNRLAMLLAVLNRHASIATYDQDVFVNVVGGVRITETGIDLALIVAIVSSLKNIIIPSDCVIFGEVGLSGEIRPVIGGQARIKEAMKHGFKRAIVPRANKLTGSDPAFQLIAIAQIGELFQHLF